MNVSYCIIKEAFSESGAIYVMFLPNCPGQDFQCIVEYKRQAWASWSCSWILEESVQFSTTECDVSCGLVIVAFIMLRYVVSILNLLRVL